MSPQACAADRSAYSFFLPKRNLWNTVKEGHVASRLQRNTANRTGICLGTLQSEMSIKNSAHSELDHHKRVIVSSLPPCHPREADLVTWKTAPPQPWHIPRPSSRINSKWWEEMSGFQSALQQCIYLFTFFSLISVYQYRCFAISIVLSMYPVTHSCHHSPPNLGASVCSLQARASRKPRVHFCFVKKKKPKKQSNVSKIRSQWAVDVYCFCGLVKWGPSSCRFVQGFWCGSLIMQTVPVLFGGK